MPTNCTHTSYDDYDDYDRARIRAQNARLAQRTHPLRRLILLIVSIILLCCCVNWLSTSRPAPPQVSSRTVR